MGLIPLIVKALSVFTVLVLIIITVSYTLYKIRAQKRRPMVHLQPAMPARVVFQEERIYPPVNYSVPAYQPPAPERKVTQTRKRFEVLNSSMESSSEYRYSPAEYSFNSYGSYQGNSNNYMGSALR